MGMNKICIPEYFQYMRLAHLFEDDFDTYIDADEWTKLAADSTATVAPDVDDRGGRVKLYTDATDNNEAALKQTNETWKIEANKPIACESLISYTEAATDDANVAFGMISDWGANALQDNGAGPVASTSGAMIFKVDGGTVWKCLTSVSTTQTISTSTKTAGGGDQILRIEIHPLTSTVARATFFVDGVPLMDASQSARNVPISHDFTFTNAAAMGLGFYVKAGGSNAETLLVDYVWAAQNR